MIANIVQTPETTGQLIFLIIMGVIILGITLYALIKFR